MGKGNMAGSFRCPGCGQIYHWRLEIAPDDGLHDFESSQGWRAELVQPTVEAKPQNPSLLLRFVNLPLQQSVISGLFAALVLTGVAFGIALFAEWKLTIFDFIYVFVGSAVFVCVVVWFVLLLIDRSTLLLNEIVEVLERVFGVDINQDNLIGGQSKLPESAEPTTTIVDFMDHGQRRGVKVELPVPDRVMKQVAHVMLKSEGRYNFSRRDMMASTSISDAQFEGLQKKFLDAGWAVYKVEGKPNSGVMLLAAGKCVLKKYL